MSTYHIRPRLKIVGNIVFVVARAIERDRAWNVIVDNLAQGSCKLTRVSDTSFSVAPNEGYDIDHCFSVAATALLFARQTDHSLYWLLSSENPIFDIKAFIDVENYTLPRSDNDLLFLRSKLIKEYASKKIRELIAEYKDQQFEDKKVYDLIEELRQGYRRLKFHQHDFWYRHFGGLQQDLGEIDCCLAEASLLLTAVKMFNSTVEAEAEHYTTSLGRKWKDSKTLDRDEFEKDCYNIRAETYRKTHQMDSANFNERLSQVRNQAIRFFPA